MLTTHKLYVLTVLGLSISACDQDPPSYQSSTRYFDVYGYDNASPLCRGEYEKIDDIFMTTRTVFGSSAAPDKTPLYLWAKREDLPCSSDNAAGCFTLPAGELHIWAQGSTLHHEVVHAATGATLHLDSHFFSEGIAETLTLVIAPQTMDFDPRPLFFADAGSFDYSRAAVFASFVIEQYGEQAAFDAFVRVRNEGLAAFESLLGSTADDISEAFMASELKCSAQTLRCAGNAVTLDTAWSYDEQLTCGHPSALGSAGAVWTEELLELDTNALVELNIEHGQFYMERCAPCAEREAHHYYAGQHVQVELNAGRYYTVLSGESFDPHVEVTLRKASP